LAALATYCAFRGLLSDTFIGIAWLLHTGWDFVHDLDGNPILPFGQTSSFGGARCDPLIARGCFAGRPSLSAVFRRGAGRAAA
jgi:Family of unknown function (DUF6010)